jgi:hypothetical protein
MKKNETPPPTVASLEIHPNVTTQSCSVSVRRARLLVIGFLLRSLGQPGDEGLSSLADLLGS